jgi:acyl carrier protein
MEQHDVHRLVVQCLCDILAEEEKAPAEPVNESTRLIGRNAVLDSLALVKLIVEVEQRMRAEYGAAITLADERAMSQKHSPFLTAGTLGAYAWSLTREMASHGGA